MPQQSKEYGVTWLETGQKRITRKFISQLDAQDWLDYMRTRLDTWDKMEDGPRLVERTITYSDWTDIE